MTRGALIVLGVLGVLVPIGIALQGFTLTTLLSIERRLTRLETLQGLAPGAGPIERREPEQLEIPTTAART